MAIPTFWQNVIDTFLPPAPESKLLRDETEESFLLYYQPRSRERIVHLSQYQEPMIQAAINANKFHGDRRATKLLASLLNQYTIHINTEHTRPIQIIPIPLSFTREKERGYNQVLQVLTALSKITQHDIRIITALKRVLHTTPQSQLKRKKRLKNVTGAFATTRHTRQLDPNRPIWIVDDVTTTGATLKAAKQALPEEIQKSIQLQLVAIAG